VRREDGQAGSSPRLIAPVARDAVVAIGGAKLAVGAGLACGALILTFTILGAVAAPGGAAGGAASCVVVGGADGPPPKLAPIYVAAGRRYDLGPRGPAILAAINYVETAFGTNLGVSSAGALGWMQFMPATWAGYGVDANGDGVKDPFDPEDAIFAAARYLRASGAPRDWHTAIFAYNHAEWYVQKVESLAARFGGGFVCRPQPSAARGDALLSRVQTLYRPRSFRAIPERLWVGGGPPQSVDSRIWPDAVWLLESHALRVTAAREAGHETHGDGTAMDMVPAPGRGWDGTARRAAGDLGWIASCGPSGSAPVCPLVPAIQFIGYNGYPGHGDPAHVGENAHLHVSWKSSDYGCPGLCPPREWVMAFALR